jgi:YfiH family protein
VIYPTDLPPTQHFKGSAFEHAGHIIRFQTQRPEHSHFCKQVHGSHIAQMEQLSIEEARSIEADALASRLSSQILGVQTADCLPILLFDDQRHMAIHAGWRGLLAGIVQKGLLTFSNPNSVYMIVGPHIFPYVVREDVIQILNEKSSTLKELQNSYTQISKDNYHLALLHVAILFATQLGVRSSRIFAHTSSTLQDPEWPSYRNGDKERMFSTIECTTIKRRET